MTTTEVTQSELTARAKALMQEALAIDALSGHIVAPEPPPLDGKSFLERLIDAGVNVSSITLGAHNDDFEHVLKMMFHYFCLMEHQRARTVHIKTVADIDRAKAEGRLGVIFGAQTAGFIGGDTWKWLIMHQLGLRIAQLCYNERNVLGDGCREPENRGLTAYGQQAVQEMNRLGICVDISHTGERTSRDAIAYSSKPVIASHANCRAIGPSQRNLTDELMHAVADSGGVMGLSPHSGMAFRVPGVRPTMEDYLVQFDYAVNTIGIDHVAIGTDLYESYTKISWESSTKRMYPNAWIWETMFSEGFEKVEQWADLVEGLMKRGFSDEDIAKILGGNWRRVFGEIWADEEGVTTPGNRGWQAALDTAVVTATQS